MTAPGRLAGVEEKVTFAAVMSKTYTSAPLPFVGQKRRFIREFRKVLEAYPEDITVVDLFGGSGLLSHVAGRCKPQARVVYNDYDNYRRRLAAIPETNRLLATLRALVADVSRNARITGDTRQRALDALRTHEEAHGYLDYITVSTSLLFSMNYRTSLEEMGKTSLYNCVRMSDYPLCPDYLAGIEVVSADYREVFNRYKDTPGVLFLVDPPYLSTEAGTYTMRWGLSDYLDVLTVLDGHDFVYFTSDKSSIVELCDWMGRHPGLGDPFRGCVRKEANVMMTHNAGYTDVMLVKQHSKGI